MSPPAPVRVSVTCTPAHGTRVCISNSPGKVRRLSASPSNGRRTLGSESASSISPPSLSPSVTPKKTRKGGDAASVAAGKAVALQAWQGLMRHAGLVAPLAAPPPPRSPSPQTRERRARAAARAVARQAWLGVLGDAGLDALSLMRTSEVDDDVDSLSDMPHDVLCHVLATFSPIELCLSLIHI